MNIETKIKEVLSMFNLEAQSKDIDLVLDLSSNTLNQVPTVQIDHVRFGQVMINLTINALKWTTGSPVRKITVSVGLASSRPEDPDSCLQPNASLPSDIKDGDALYLYTGVTDTGPGISPEDLHLMFKRFSQANPYGSSNKVFGGSGLGLYVSKQIVLQMGGGIQVDSEYGKGCTFRFYVKVKAAEMDKRSKTPLPSLAGTPTAQKPGPSRKANVLVVEDNMINQTILVRQLRKAGMTCEAANDGLQAINRLKEVCTTAPNAAIDKPFDVVLMDLEMPVCDGLTAIREIREMEKQGTLIRSTVYALTGNARQAQIDTALAAGMDQVIIKPYNIASLLQKIDARMEEYLSTEQQSSPSSEMVSDSGS